MEVTSGTQFQGREHFFFSDFQASDEDGEFATRSDSKPHFSTESGSIPKTGIELTFLPVNSVPQFMISMYPAYGHISGLEFSLQPTCLEPEMRFPHVLS